VAHGIPVIATDERLHEIVTKGVVMAANGVGSVKDNGPRRHVYEQLRKAGFTLPQVVHPTAWICKSATLGDGAQVMAGALIQHRVVLDANVLINTGAIIEHDCRIDAHVHICTGVRIGGDVTIGDGAFIGIGTTIRQGIHIGANALVGAGSIVVKNVEPGEFVGGVVARPRS
jgi:UDP-perosamine 4-acetyltransferase